MVRVADALEFYAPDTVEVVNRLEDADLAVSHVIGPDQTSPIPEAVIQYCAYTADQNFDKWHERWMKARLVWSYYDLPALAGRNGFPFYYAPLGVDVAFTDDFFETGRDGILTSGYVSGPGAEAIEEVATIATMLEIPIRHLGPSDVQGCQLKLHSILGVSDQELAKYYRACKWVSGLRHVEGFELPVIEGLCCGARPIVFDRPDMRQWYDGHAVFIPESSGHQLMLHLLDVLGEPPEPVSRDERLWAAHRFDWEPIATEFWERLDA